MEHDAWFFIGVFVFIFLMWVATGGPLHPLSFAGPGLSQPSPIGGGTYLSLPRAPLGIGSGNVTLPDVSGGFGSSGSGSTGTGGGATGVYTNPSPYRGLVVMNHGVSSAGAADPTSEYIQLYVPSSAGSAVDISGWQLVSQVTGNGSYIPRGTEVPTTGTINQAQDIVLTPGTRAYIISGQSPIGASFRENKCVGYYGNFQTFYPSLSNLCPVPSDELAAHYPLSYRDPSCVDYVNKLNRCQAVLTPPVNQSSDCQAFLVNYLNYNGCATAHRQDADFLGDTWRIYLGRSNSMWRPNREIVELLDRDGKVVDAFSY